MWWLSLMLIIASAHLWSCAVYRLLLSPSTPQASYTLTLCLMIYMYQVLTASGSHITKKEVRQVYKWFHRRLQIALLAILSFIQLVWFSVVDIDRYFCGLQKNNYPPTYVPTTIENLSHFCMNNDKRLLWSEVIKIIIISFKWCECSSPRTINIVRKHLIEV